MVNYRGPKILESFCEYWKLDLFDRVVKIQLYENPNQLAEAVGQFSELETLTLEYTLTEWLATGGEFESAGADVCVMGREFEGRFFPQALVISGPRQVGPWTPPEGTLRWSLAEYQQEQATRVAASVSNALQSALEMNPIPCELGSELLACSVKAQDPKVNK